MKIACSALVAHCAFSESELSEPPAYVIVCVQSSVFVVTVAAATGSTSLDESFQQGQSEQQ
jgi:hypothetical protein